MEEEDALHLYQHYPFTKEVWILVLHQLNLKSHHEALNLEGVLWTWYCDQQVNSFKDLPMYICRGIWNNRNKAIFENK